MPVRAIRSRVAPPSTVHHSEIVSRSGDSMPVQADCAVTAKTRPEITERRLPWAASTSSRLEQPRARIMPMPNSAPPTAAPEIEPRAEIWRASVASKAPTRASACVATTAVAKANSQTVSLPPLTVRANSITAERRQKRERCAKKPKASPITSPVRASVHGSPMRSVKVSKLIQPPPAPNLFVHAHMELDEPQVTPVHAAANAVGDSRSVTASPSDRRGRASPVRQRCPLEGERRSRFGGGPVQGLM